MKVVVAIPTFNAGPSFSDVLEAVRRQDPPPEVLVVDSGSTDATVSYARAAGARVHEIPNSDFGHGRTRNLVVTLVDADVIVFLTQDAQPLPRWLEHLTSPFALSPRIAAVFGSQRPRPGVRAPVERELQEVAARLGPSDGLVVHGGEFSGDPPSWAAQFFSNVTSAVRRTVLEAIPFRDVSYAEDQALVADLHDAGLLTAYAPLAAVLHSHDYPLGDFFRRTYDDTVGLRTAAGRVAKPGLSRHLAAVAVLSAKDAAVAMRGQAPVRDRVSRAFASPVFETARRSATALGGRDLPAFVHRRLSLESRRRRGA